MIDNIYTNTIFIYSIYCIYDNKDGNIFDMAYILTTEYNNRFSNIRNLFNLLILN